MTTLAEHIPTPDQINPLNEAELVNQHLAELEAYAATPTEEREGILYMASVEREFRIGTSAEYREVARRIADNPAEDERLRKHGLTIPKAHVAELTPQAQEAKVEEAKADARALIRSLKPSGPEEEQKQIDWYADIDNFTIEDAINFRLYQEFSEPTLGKTAVPQGLTYEQLQEYSEKQGKLEFRFGTGNLQTGYYDNPGVSEIRTTPASPTELVEHDERIETRLAEIAGEHGCVVMLLGRHINLSAYREDASGSKPPIIGNNPAHSATTLDATAGITAAMEDGVWLSQATAADVLNYHDVYRDGSARFEVSSHERRAIRLNPDYLELRHADVIPSTAQGLLWLIAGATHGLESGWGQVAAERKEVPLVVNAVEVARTEEFDKQKHLHIQRALENSTVQEDGTFDLQVSYLSDRGERIARAFSGMQGSEGDMFQDKVLGYAFSILAVRSLRADENGALHCDMDSFYEAFDSLIEAGQAALGNMQDSTVARQLVETINQNVKTVRLVPRIHIEAKVPFEGLDPDQRRARLAGSAAMRLAYGEDTSEYLDALTATASEAYKATSFEDAVDKKLEAQLNKIAGNK